jgi:hypothetical protein
MRKEGNPVKQSRAWLSAMRHRLPRGVFWDYSPRACVNYKRNLSRESIKHLQKQRKPFLRAGLIQGVYMKHIAILTSADMMPGGGGLRPDFFELEEQMAKLEPAFLARGMKAELVLWNDAPQRAPEFDAMLPLFVWDYCHGDNAALFLAMMERASQKTCILNPLSILKTNSDKAYLETLGAQGAPIIPSLITDRVTPEFADKAYDHFGCDSIVAKPQVGAGAWRQALLKHGDAFPPRSELPPARAIVQPFLPSVLSEGELSFLYFNGQFSHAVNKRPKAGEYRIQSSFGGTERPYSPSAVEQELGASILALLEHMPLYARVDLLRGLDGELKLIELEMIEPYLYFPFASGEGGDNAGARKLATALAARL